METAVTAPVADNTGRGRFELDVGGQIVFAQYRRNGDGSLAITHVEAPPSLRGTGASDRLMRGMLALVRQRGEKVVPLCGYARAWIRRHKDYADLLA